VKELPDADTMRRFAVMQDERFALEKGN